MTTPANNKDNVSTTRGVKGGYLYEAALTATGAPTKSNYQTWASAIPNDWNNLGYIPADGLNETADKEDGDIITDINLDPVDKAEGTTTESVTVALMEVAKNPLSTIYGHENVTDEDGTIEVLHNWSNASEHRQYVFLLLLKNGRKWVKYIPDGVVTALGDLTLNKSTVAQREVTITYNTDDDGNGCIDWIESNETEAV